jgi:organic radical activating enzyme
MECDVVDICNLKCKYCSHLTSWYETNHYSFEEYKRDVIALSNVLRCEEFSLLGGEPLILGDKLIDYVDVLRVCGISKKIRIITNGILMERNAEVLKKFDSIWVSLYPSKHKEFIEKWINEHRHEYPDINVMQVNDFGEFFTKEVLSDEQAESSWKSCGVNDICNTIYKGTYYRCVAAAKFHRFLDNMNIFNVHHDGCNLHQENLEFKLKEYINSDRRLSTCSHCLGGSKRISWNEEGKFYEF